MVGTLRDSFKFTEPQLEQLQTEVAKAANGSGIATSNRFASLEEDWNMHPLFRPTAADDLIVASPPPSERINMGGGM